MSTKPQFLLCTLYKFIALDDFVARRAPMLIKLQEYNILGTVPIARILWDKDYKQHEDHVRHVLAIKDEIRFKKIITKKGWCRPPEIDKETPKDIDSLNNQTNESSTEYGTSDNNIGETSSGDAGSEGLPDETHEKERGTTGDNTRKHSGGHSQGETKSVRQTQNRLISYVAGETTDDDSNNKANKQRQEQRRERGKKGEIAVKTDPEAKGYKVECMPDGNKGYDLSVTDLGTSAILYVEVKSVADVWGETGVGLTSKQHECGLTKASSFYLAVFEETSSNIYYIQDPVNKITRYQFDEGWEKFSTDFPKTDITKL